MILGISGSPRANGVTAAAVKKVLAECGGETEYISLAGKKINGCISCLGCIHDNRCIVSDDFPAIAEAMASADAIVFGAPNYYGTMNALSHCLWERCFCFRHRSEFVLKDIPIVIISTGYSSIEENNAVFKAMELFVLHNKMTQLNQLTIGAYSQCYDCACSKNCIDGNVVKKFGIVDRITPEMRPETFEQQPESILKCNAAAILLQKFLKDRSAP